MTMCIIILIYIKYIKLNIFLICGKKPKIIAKIKQREYIYFDSKKLCKCPYVQASLVKTQMGL